LKGKKKIFQDAAIRITITEMGITYKQFDNN